MLHEDLLQRLEMPESERIESLRVARLAAVRDENLKNMLASGQALDVSFYPRAKNGDYLLPGLPLQGIVLVDAFWSCYIRSIGIAKKRIALEMQNGTCLLLPQGCILCSSTLRYVSHDAFHHVNI